MKGPGIPCTARAKCTYEVDEHRSSRAVAHPVRANATFSFAFQVEFVVTSKPGSAEHSTVREHSDHSHPSISVRVDELHTKRPVCHTIESSRHMREAARLFDRDGQERG